MSFFKNIADVVNKQNEAIKKFSEAVKTPAQGEDGEALKERAKKVLNRIKENEMDRVQEELIEIQESLTDIENRLLNVEYNTETETKILNLSERIDLLEEKIEKSINESAEQRNRIESSVKSAKILGFIGIAAAIILAIVL